MMKCLSLLALVATSLQAAAFITPGGPATSASDSSLRATSSYLKSLTTSTAATTPAHGNTPQSTSSRAPPAYTRTFEPAYEPPKLNGHKFTSPSQPIKFVDIPAPAPLEVEVQAPPAPTKPGDYTQMGDIDEAAMLAQSSFPIKPDELIAKAKEVIFVKGIGANDGAQCLAENFVFRGAHVETKRDDFVKSMDTFNLADSFAIKQQFFGWNVDPLQPNRVWFMNRQEATQIEDFYGAKCNGKKLVLPPEMLHIDFNERGQVKEFGFYVVDRAQGNTGGLGGAFGYFYGVGQALPFPECKPYKVSKRRRFFEFLGRTLTNVREKYQARREKADQAYPY